VRWITRSQVHLDRVATPWLIVRFVDPAAEFEFVEWDESADASEGVIWFGVPDVELGTHDARGTCFRKVLDRFELRDPALERMERIIASGVADALGTDPPSGQTDDEATLGAALNRLGNGLGIVLDDHRHLEVGLALYEALYALCRVELLAPEERASAPAARPEQIAYLRSRLELASIGNGERRAAVRAVAVGDERREGPT
jgi:hypothetical protein